MLSIMFVNDRSGTALAANYYVRILVNRREIASHRVTGHDRRDDWRALTRKLLAATGGASMWQPIASAPTDRLVLVWAAPAHDLPGFVTVCQWHPDAGFTVDELRPVTHWQPLPPPPD